MNAGPLNPDSWQYRQINARAPGLSYLSNALISLVEQGAPIAAGTADLQYSNGLVRFAQRYPERFTQFGISEQNMVSAAAGMATVGTMPFVATFASFLALLCCEQIRTDIAYSALPVRLIGHHAGISLGFYGTSHHATEDLAIMRSIADLTVVAPADGPQFAAAIKASIDHPQPIYFRIGRGQEPVVYDDEATFSFGKAVSHGEGSEITLVACGSMVHPAREAWRALTASGVSASLIDMHTIKPLDEEAVLQTAMHDQLAPIGPDTWDCAVASANLAANAAEGVIEGDDVAYALCRPSGHHVSHGCGGGATYPSVVHAVWLASTVRPIVNLLDHGPMRSA